jgi:hypothetical protein
MCAASVVLGMDDEDDEYGRTANDAPHDETSRELRQIFEAAVGETYVKLAYKLVYWLARRLMRFATFELRSNEDYEEMEAMLEEWAGLRYSDDGKVGLGSDEVDVDGASERKGRRSVRRSFVASARSLRKSVVVS